LWSSRRLRGNLRTNLRTDLCAHLRTDLCADLLGRRLRRWLRAGLRRLRGSWRHQLLGRVAEKEVVGEIEERSAADSL
jgi:hypothetical protein